MYTSLVPFYQSVPKAVRIIGLIGITVVAWVLYLGLFAWLEGN